jgi:hypothetical protein
VPWVDVNPAAGSVVFDFGPLKIGVPTDSAGTQSQVDSASASGVAVSAISFVDGTVSFFD